MQEEREETSHLAVTQSGNHLDFKNLTFCKLFQRYKKLLTLAAYKKLHDWKKGMEEGFGGFVFIIFLYI